MQLDIFRDVGLALGSLLDRLVAFPQVDDFLIQKGAVLGVTGAVVFHQGRKKIPLVVGEFPEAGEPMGLIGSQVLFPLNHAGEVRALAVQELGGP